MGLTDSSFFSTDSTTFTVLTPICRRISNVTAGFPLKYEKDRRSAMPSSAYPTSRTRMGAPRIFLMMMLPNSGTPTTRPNVRTPTSVGPRTMRPPGASMFSATTAVWTSCAVRLYAFSLFKSIIRLICRARPPERSTPPTPSTVSSARRICLSAISVISRTVRDPLIASVITGSLSGSAFWTTGGSTFGGRFRIAPLTFSRTSSVASLMSRSRTKVGEIIASPSKT